MKKLLTICVTVMFLAACQKDDTPTREDYIGSWTCDENSQQSGQTKFTVHIKDGSGSDKVIFENLYNFGFNNTVTATVVEDQITIPKQTFSGSNQIVGSGTMTSMTRISLSYTVTDSSGTDNVTATLSKQ